MRQLTGLDASFLALETAATTNWPGSGSGTASSVNSQSVAVGRPSGRAASRTCRLIGDMRRLQVSLGGTGRPGGRRSLAGVRVQDMRPASGRGGGLPGHVGQRHLSLPSRA